MSDAFEMRADLIVALRISRDGVDADDAQVGVAIPTERRGRAR
jgi:hypothetical protein